MNEYEIYKNYKNRIPGENLFEKLFYFYDKTMFSGKLTYLMKKKQKSFLVKIVNRYDKLSLLDIGNAFIFFVHQKYKGTYEDYFLITKYLIIEFLIILFAHIDDSDDIFKCQGKLYMCLLNEYFGIKKKDPNRKIVYIKESHIFPKLLSNWSESCYLDSLLSVLIFGDCSDIRKNLFNKKYTSDPTNFKNPLTTKTTNTPEKAENYSLKLQNQLKKIYKLSLNVSDEYETFECVDLRKLLLYSNPKMAKIIERGDRKYYRYKTYTPSEIYHTLSTLFDLYYVIPVLIGGKKNVTKRNMFTTWEFVDPSENKEGEDILWDKINAPYLVFQSGVYPKLKNYSAAGPQEISVLDFKNGNMKIATRTVNIQRVFGEYILNDKYRLFGIVVHRGYTSAGHYISYIRPFFNLESWFYYDDIDQEFHEIRFSKTMFANTSSSRPEMLFYIKV